MTKRCPSCHQIIPPVTGVRVCSKCGDSIGLHDKYRWSTKDGITTLAHRHCDNKQSYLPKKSKALNN